MNIISTISMFCPILEMVFGHLALGTFPGLRYINLQNGLNSHILRDTPPMTVAKIIMIQGSPLQHQDTLHLTPANSAASSSTSTISSTSGSTSGSASSRRRASRTVSGGNSVHTSGETISRKRRKVHSGMAHQFLLFLSS